MCFMQILKSNKNKSKNDKDDGKGGKRIGKRQLLSNILTVIIVFMLITSAYSLIAENRKKKMMWPFPS